MRFHPFAFGVTLCLGLFAHKTARAQDAGAAEVCQRWTCDRINLAEGASTADVATCTPGTWQEPGPANSLRLVNLYRFLAAMPTVTEDSSYDSFAQDCALLQAANSALTHTPDASENCYTANAATGSNHSSICSGQGVACIDLYMSDDDSPEMGHRRWILANYLGPVGFGSVGTGYPSMTGSCFYQPAGSANANKAFVAWPPPGNFPLQAVTTLGLDTAGWTIQSDSINLNSATVTVTDGATNRPVTVTALPANYGSTYAIQVLPTGWTSTAGHSYAVSVGGISSTISYTVDMVDCTTIDAGACPADAGAPGGGDGGTVGTSTGTSTATETSTATSTTDTATATATSTTTSGPSDASLDATVRGGGGGATPSGGAKSSGCSCDVPGAGSGRLSIASVWVFGAGAMFGSRRRRPRRLAV
jgi:hypothetical protein